MKFTQLQSELKSFPKDDNISVEDALSLMYQVDVDLGDNGIYLDSCKYTDGDKLLNYITRLGQDLIFIFNANKAQLAKAGVLEDEDLLEISSDTVAELGSIIADCKAAEARQREEQQKLQKLSAAKDDLAKKQAAVKAAQKNTEQLHTACTDLINEITSALANGLNSGCQDLQAELSAMQTQLSAAKSAYETQLQANETYRTGTLEPAQDAAKTAKEAAEQLEAELATAQGEKAQAEQAARTAGEEKAEAERIKAERTRAAADLRSEAAAYKQEADRLSGEITELDGEKRRAKESIADFEGKLAEAKAGKDAIVSEARQKSQQKTDAFKECQKLRLEISEYDADIRQYTEDIRALKEQKREKELALNGEDGHSGLTKDAQDLRDRINTLDGEIKTLREHTIPDINETISSKKEEKQKVAAELEQLQAKQQAIQQEIDRLNGIDDSAAGTNTIPETLNAIQRITDALRQKAGSQLQAGESELSRMGSELDSRKEELTDLSNKLEEHSSALQEVQQDISRYKASLKMAQDGKGQEELTNLENTRKHLQEICNALNSDAAALNRNFNKNAFDERLDSIRKSLDKISQALKDAAQAINEEVNEQ